MNNTSFPSLGNLPQWSRVGRLDKSSSLQLGIQNNQGPQPHSQSQSVEAWKKDPHNLVMDLERSLKFLQQQHAETLMKLHEEIEYLRRENKEFHYKLIMNQSLQIKGDNLTPTLSDKFLSRQSSAAAAGSKYSVTNRQQMDHPKKQKLNTEEQVVNVVQGEQEPPCPKVEKPQEEVLSREDREVSDKITSRVLSLPCQIKSEQAQVPPASSNPFLVSVLPSHIRKPPTLEECEIVIHQLWNINHMQAQELMYLKSYLEDIHKNKRIPEDYLLASQIGNQEVSRLPKMLKGTSKKCLILTPLPAAERAVLPALKQTLGNSFAERQKRTQAIQRSRLRRTVL
ncbi:coiled-coil domain-containing protein 74B-like isoform X1 [Mauremys reevesii]|uniref:coiled-coil domain-containing protein 74B-like isoform X1 n=1 Tax=Mauremys reevesii TaxID=260615 RepID=UPI00193F073C|nr:coiled-coil domain-containing protein 74B-like isoform X1 [Mauremys reevesii]XP_039360892.1 coiled-coil domain-containing protein 74B-like isoform X1 [Mauremys reevesii]